MLRLGVLWEGLQSLLFPGSQSCLVCHRGEESGLCLPCSETLRFMSGEPHCNYCGRFAAEPQQGEGLCPECRFPRWYFQRCRAFAPYEGILKEALHLLKYQGARNLAEPLGVMMGRNVLRHQVYFEADYLVPVPLTEEVFLHRGFNQSQLLANFISQELATPILPVLAKTRCTPAQSTLSRAGRIKNVQGVFAAVENVQRLKNRTVILVDDILTTGSTLNEASRILKGAGAERVLGLVAAAGRC